MMHHINLKCVFIGEDKLSTGVINLIVSQVDIRYAQKEEQFLAKHPNIIPQEHFKQREKCIVEIDKEIAQEDSQTVKSDLALLRRVANTIEKSYK